MNNPFFTDQFIWKDKNKAYTLLLHSININDSTISGYSIKSHTLMTFPILSSDLNSIYKQLEYLPYSSDQCIKCHNGDWN